MPTSPDKHKYTYTFKVVLNKYLNKILTRRQGELFRQADFILFQRVEYQPLGIYVFVFFSCNYVRLNGVRYTQLLDSTCILCVCLSGGY